MENNPEKFKVFFISSHLEVFSDIKYIISEKNQEKSDLEIFSTKIVNKEDVTFDVKVFTFSFKKSKNKNKTKKIKLIGYGSDEFIGIINFSPKKNIFIYDFSFNICHKENKDIPPPQTLKLTKYQQFNLFNELIHKEQFKKDESLFDDLLNDSFFYLKDNQDYYYINYYLLLLCNCYMKKNIIELLSYFNLDKIKLSEKKEKESEIFSKVLFKIKHDPEIITKHLNNNNLDINKYLTIFYTLLLYYRQNYEAEEKINELFEENNTMEYYKIILFSNKDHFNKISVPFSFIEKILQTDFEMNYDNLLLILKYLKRFEKILLFVNKYSQTIAKIFENEKNNDNDGEEEEEEQKEEGEEEEEKEEKKIDLIKIISIQEDDDINAISDEIKKLLEKETTILNHLDIGHDFWKEYSQFFCKKDLNKLLTLEKIIANIKNKRKDLIEKSNFIYSFIHETGLEMALNHKFKDNIELLQFIKEKDIYYI